MITEFEQGKRYRFLRSKYKQVETDYEEHKAWVDEITGMEVGMIINSQRAFIGFFAVFSEWCEEIQC